MVRNKIDFYSIYSSAPVGSSRTTPIPVAPFGITIPAGAVLWAEVNFCSYGTMATAYPSMSRWLFGWKYISAGVVSSAAINLISGLVLAFGSNPVTVATAGQLAGSPRVSWKAPVSGSIKNWSLHGYIWFDS
jgi:hypothetical protein